MGKFRISEEEIKKKMGVEKEFSDIEEFVQFLYSERSGGNQKISKQLKALIVGSVLRGEENKAESDRVRNRDYEENVLWIRENCCIVKERDITREQPDVQAGRDFKKVKAAFEETDYKKVKQLEESDLDYTEGIVLHEGGIITQQNNIQIYVLKAGIKLDLSKILIVEAEGNKVLALGYLVPEGEDAYTVVFNDKKCIDYEAFRNIRQARFIVYTKDQIYSRMIEMDYEPFQIEKERPLCIDFGTSNTTAGSYGILDRKADAAEVVHFIDVTVYPNNTEAVLLPTVVYVEDCSDKDNIKYLFGYEARKRIEEEHYESKASVYYEIKRWMADPDEAEEIRDNENNKAKPLKKDIIKAYIDYVIESAEQYFATRFEKIHFSAPVKLKEKFISVFSELYENEKKILSVEESIDEGIAIVYNQIITLLYAGGTEEKQDGCEKSIMIMDCGGGTTDLASCEYKYQKTEAGMELSLNTCFENGNANFGGNNITYRIMQLLKIKAAAVLSDGVIDNGGEAKSLIDKSENDILGLVEAYMKENPYDSDKASSDIYDRFLDNYNRAESIIPTQYVGNQKYRGTESLKKIKRNFYYLWRQAEQIKIEFYRTERVLMNFMNSDEDAIKIKGGDNYYLYVADETNANNLRKESNPFEKVSITIKEVNRVICGDIYALLVGLFQNGELTSRKMRLEDFNYYKLSGQSCKISLFSELIKEYIPGRKFRPAIEKSGGVDKKNSEDLKLDCVLGSINYVKDQIRPEMKITANPSQPEIIYNVSLKGNHNQDKVLFDCKKPKEIKMEISHKNTREYPLIVTGKDDVVEREFIFVLRDSEKKDMSWTTQEIKKKLVKTSLADEAEIDKFIKKVSDAARNTREVVNIVFIVPAKQGYGVRIGQIQAQSTEDASEYRLLRYKYENFEDSSKTFFDGRR